MTHLEAEMSVLGALLLDNKLYVEISPKLRDMDFGRQDHRVIYRAIGKMTTAGRACDFILLGEALRQRGQLEEAGGITYLGSLAADTYSIANVGHYADLVREYADRRRLHGAAQEIIRSKDLPSGEVRAQLQAALAEVEVGERGVMSWNDVLTAAEARMLRAKAKRTAGGTVGIPCGLPCIDQAIGGFGEGQLWLIAARPSTGKSALLGQMGISGARQGHPGLIISLEMLGEEIGIRAMAAASQRNVAKLFRGYEEELNAGCEATAHDAGLPLWVDSSTRTLEGILGRIAQMRARHQIQWAAVDHIGLVTSQGFKNRVDLIGHMSGSFKELAMRLGIPIILLTQLNREVAKDKRQPQLTDLRDSGRLEEDADGVIFLHTEPKPENPERIPIDIGILKNRNGRSGFYLNDKIYFNGATQTFTEETIP